jgi:predicted ribosome quality control (RQC) complex YloA/Tae2 family protein
MHNSFFFLRLLSRQLSAEITGYRFREIFSQQKNELIIVLEKDTETRYMRGLFNPDFCGISFPTSFNRARRNSVDLFKPIIGNMILDVIQVENDRSFYFTMENGYSLLFKMHGNRANILLFHNGVLLELFRNNLRGDLGIQLDALGKKSDFTESQLESVEGNYKKFIPTLGAAFDEFLMNKGYWSSNNSSRYRLLCELLLYLDSPEIFIHEEPDKKPVLTLFLRNIEDRKYNLPTDALNDLFKKWVAEYLVNREKQQQKLLISQQIEKAEFFIASQMQKISELEKKYSFERLGDLLMANLHLVKPRSTTISLPDFYTGELIHINLKSNLTPQDNAARYYRKSKKQRLEVGHLQESIASKEQMIAELNLKLLSLEKTGSKKEMGKAPISDEEPSNLPYHHVRFMNYDILIGKNAQKNEQLTFKVAQKNDLFLHACDVPGSHVIVRMKPAQNIPQPVLEKAAAFAAFSSKSKSESLVRIAYTSRKYVRKPKGMPAGTVVIEKEKTLLVRPEAFKK